MAFLFLLSLFSFFFSFLFFFLSNFSFSFFFSLTALDRLFFIFFFSLFSLLSFPCPFFSFYFLLANISFINSFLIFSYLLLLDRTWAKLGQFRTGQLVTMGLTSDKDFRLDMTAIRDSGFVGMRLLLAEFLLRLRFYSRSSWRWG